MKSPLFKRSLISVAIASSVFATPMVTAEQSQNVVAESSEQKEKDVERVVVTGSRIARVNMETASPVVSIDTQQIKNTGFVNVNDFLTKMPQFALGNDSSTGNYSFGNAGLNTANLRGLGSARTLTVVNGRRIVQSATDSGSLVTDTGFIPVDLLERTDILTGGASSTYGSDAVAGVVNFVLKKDFEGTTINGYFGESEYGDGQAKTVTITSGKNFLNDDLNLAFSYDYYDSGFASSSLRPGAGARTDWITNPEHNPDAENVDSDGIPAKIIAHNVTWPDYHIPGRIMAIWNEDEERREFYNITNGDPTYLFHSNEIVNSYRLLNQKGFDPVRDGKVSSPYERHNFYFVGNYAISDTLALSFDARYTDVNSKNSISPEFHYGSWGKKKYIADGAQLSDGIWDLVNHDGYFFAPYTLNDLGERISRTDRNMYSLSTTLEGELGLDWVWDLYLATGKTNNDTLLYNRAHDYRLYKNYTYGPDGICGVQDMSCPAWNSLQAMSEEVQDYVRVAPYGQQIDTEQHLFAASLSGPVMELPAGEVYLAAGVEARRESIDVNVDETWQDEYIMGENKTRMPWEQARNIYEAFVEIDVPIIQDVFLINELNLNVAARYADYEYSGENTSWKIAADWSVIEDLTIRSTLAHAVRAPQLKELFGAPSAGFSNGLSDPCDQENINTLPADKKQLVIANCKAFGVEDPENFESATNIATGTNVITSGNPYLEVEKADTLTFGLAYQPEFIENAAITIDYYDIKLEDSIENTSTSAIIYECAESDDIANSVYCPLVTRDENGDIVNVLKAPVNKGAFRRRGVDIEATYDIDLAPVELKFTLYATHIIESSSQSSKTEEIKQYQGVGRTPDWKGRFIIDLYYEDFSVNWSIDHSTATLVARDATAEDYSDHKTPSLTRHNLRVKYQINDDVNVYAGVRNLFDESWTHHPSTSSYALMGRYYYAGFKYSF